MNEINLYPEMNKEIINILRLSPENTMNLYAARLIEHLTLENEKLRGLSKAKPERL